MQCNYCCRAIGAGRTVGVNVVLVVAQGQMLQRIVYFRTGEDLFGWAVVWVCITCILTWWGLVTIHPGTCNNRISWFCNLGMPDCCCGSACECLSKNWPLTEP
jgi:hypothetical protein